MMWISFVSLPSHSLDEPGVSRRLWQLIDRVVQQIAIQEDDGGDPDVAPLDINVNYILDTWVIYLIFFFKFVC